jgi:hypothetical protein
VELTPRKPLPLHHIGTGERRRYVRIDLSCPLRLSLETQAQSPPLLTNTGNISSNGFYCLVQQQFSVGDRIHCEIEISIRRFAIRASELWLTGKATIVHVHMGEAGFGIGCQFEDFALAIS